MNLFRLHICTPSGTVFEGEIARFSCRGVSGDFAVMAGHIPFVSAVVPGRCRVYLPTGDTRDGRCSGGLLSVTKENVRLLCSEFTWDE